MKNNNLPRLLGLTTSEFIKFAIQHFVFGSLLVLFVAMITQSISTTIVALSVVVMISALNVVMKRHTYLHEQTKDASAMLSLLDMIYVRKTEGLSLIESFESIRQYADQNSIKKINNLLNECEIDSTPNPFIHLASHYQNQCLKSIILTIATLRDQIPSEKTLCDIFVQLSETHQDVITDHLNYVDQQFQWFTLHPLGASFIFVASFGISVLALIAN